MNYTHWLVIISTIISLSGAYAYIRDTLRGKTQPNRVSWTMWAVAPLIGTFAALAADADMWATIRTFLAGFVPLLVVIVSFFNKKSYWKMTTFDFICGVLSLFAIIIWQLIQSPVLAILIAAIADGIASLPTIIKAWRYPHSETGFTYIMSFISVMLVLPSIPVWNIENSAFQIYLIVVNIFLILGIYRKRIFQIKKNISHT